MLRNYLVLFCLFLGTTAIFGQKVEMRVLDENGKALIGVSVYSEDYRYTASTDVEGKFTLPELAFDLKIYFSYVGYEKRVIESKTLRSLRQVQLTPLAKKLQEVTVIGRRNERASELPYQIERISKDAIASTQSPTAADALRDHAGVFIQKSQGGGGSPILRGFEANKLLLVVDGVRMNNAIYRNGHLQNAITVDAAMLEQMEVIYGPGSLTYGSDALGGVIHFRSKMPKLSFSDQAKVETNFYTRYATANQEKSAHLDFNFGKRNWASLTSLTYSDFGDLRAGSNRKNLPDDFGKRPFYVKTNITSTGIEDEILVNENPNTQVGTAYNQFDLLQKFRFQPSEAAAFTVNIQYSNSSNIPRYDRLTVINSEDTKDLKFAEWYYGPQQRLLTSLQAQFFAPNTFYDKALFIAAYQKIDEERFDRQIGKSGRSFQLEYVNVFSITADLDKYLSSNEKHIFSYGFDWNYNNVQSEAGVRNLIDNTIERSEPTRYPSSGSDVNIAAAYGSYRWKSRDSVLNLNTGLRYTYTNTYSLFGADDPILWSPDYYKEGVRNEDSDLTWGIGLTANTKDGWQFRVSGASSFRAPNLDDFSKIRVKDGFVTIPNPNLDSERTLNGELTIGKISTIANSQVQVNATGFYTRLKNAIVRTNFPLPDGSFLLELDDELLQTQANVNAEIAYIYGASANLKIDFTPTLQLFSNINWTYGRRISPYEGRLLIDELILPLDHIPPLYGRTSLSYQNDKFRLEGIVRYNGAKEIKNYAVLNVQPDPLDRGLIYIREGSADNLEQTPLCDDGTYCIGTPAWMTYNLYAHYNFGKFTVQLGFENISDVHYRPFASGVSAAGRNIIFGIRGNF